MDVVHARCAGLDVHQATVVATVRVPAERGGRQVVTQTFSTMTAALLMLRDWLQAFGVTHVALESTGVYWKPVYYVLEDAFALLLINMQELKHVPGRKTDVQDSEWLAQLLECGLLKASFVPPPPGFASCATSPATAGSKRGIGPKRSTACAKSWRMPA